MSHTHTTTNAHATVAATPQKRKRDTNTKSSSSKKRVTPARGAKTIAMVSKAAQEGEEQEEKDWREEENREILQQIRIVDEACAESKRREKEEQKAREEREAREQDEMGKEKERQRVLNSDKPEAYTAMVVTAKAFIQSNWVTRSMQQWEGAYNALKAWLEQNMMTVEGLEASSEEEGAAVLVNYIQHCISAGNTQSTIRGKVSNIRSCLRWRYNEHMQGKFRHKLVRDASHIAKRMGVAKKAKPGVTMSMLRRIGIAAEREDTATAGGSFKAVRDSFMLETGMGAFLRQSEIVGLKEEDVSIVQHAEHGEVLVVYVARAKNDQSGNGHTRHIAGPQVGAEEDAQGPEGERDIMVGTKSWCDKFRQYMARKRKWEEEKRKTQRKKERKREKQGKEGKEGDWNWYEGVEPGKRPLFNNLTNNEALAKDTVSGVVKHWLEKIGEPNFKEYSSHSLRRGGCTAAAQQGVSVDALKQHGNWKSDAVYDYISLNIAQQLVVTGFLYK